MLLVLLWVPLDSPGISREITLSVSQGTDAAEVFILPPQ